MTIPYDELVKNLDITAQKFGQQAPQLLIVSKNQPWDKITPFLDRGHCLFGENRVQEAAQKWPNLKEKYSDVRLHLIGPLQTNKIPQALELFDVIETIDRPKLAEQIDRLWDRKRDIKFLIQINTGNEPQKSGVRMADFPHLYHLCTRELQLPIIGLMCIPPVQEDPHTHFQQLATMAQEYHLDHLSMGMSQDYQEAIACGTSWVRIGTALFGER